MRISCSAGQQIEEHDHVEPRSVGSVLTALERVGTGTLDHVDERARIEDDLSVHQLHISASLTTSLLKTYHRHVLEYRRSLRTAINAGIALRAEGARRRLGRELGFGILSRAQRPGARDRRRDAAQNEESEDKSKDCREVEHVYRRR